MGVEQNHKASLFWWLRDETKPAALRWGHCSLGFTCPLCLCVKSSSPWTKPNESSDHAGNKMPARFSKAPFKRVLMCHQNLAEIVDRLNACKPMGCDLAFLTLCGNGELQISFQFRFPLVYLAVMEARMKPVPLPVFFRPCTTFPSYLIRIPSHSVSSACSLA